MKKTLLLLFLLSIAVHAIAQKKPLIVFVTGDHEYSGEQTLPLIAAELEKNYGFRTKVLKAYPDQNLAVLDKLIALEGKTKCSLDHPIPYLLSCTVCLKSITLYLINEF